MDLGLTLVQARVYLALVESGISKISTISNISKVARPDTYNNIKKLQKLGLVEAIIQSPKTYRAIPITEALSLLLERRKTQFRKVRAETLILIDNKRKDKKKKKKKKKLNNANQIEKHQFIIIPGGTAVTRIKAAIGKAQIGVDFVLSWKKFTDSILNVFAESIETSWLRNVKSRFIIECPFKDETVKKLVCFYSGKPSCRIRYINPCPETNIVVCDKNEVFMLLDPSSDLRTVSAFWSNNPNFVSLAAEYFEKTWLNALESIPQT